VQKVKSFVERVSQLTGRKPIIYTSGGFWRPYMTYEKNTNVDWAAEYPLWIAHYTNQWPNPLYPWEAWDFWQFSDRGRLPGIKTNVDLNWFIGSLSELKRRFLPNSSQAKSDFTEGKALLEPSYSFSNSIDFVLGETEIKKSAIQNIEKIKPLNVQNSKKNERSSHFSFFSNKYAKKEKRASDPQASQTWIDEIVFRDDYKDDFLEH